MVTPLPNEVTSQNPYETASSLMGGARDTLTGIANGGALENINAYLNPYYEQVVQSAMSRMDITRDKGLTSIGDAAAASGAFGGSRHGVMEGEFLGQDQLNRAQLEAEMMSRGFTEASSGLRSDLFNSASGMQNLGSQYYGIGNDVADRQGAAGDKQHQLLMALLQGSQGDYESMVQSPYETIDLFNALLGNDPRRASGTTTQSSTPGLFDYLSLASGMGSAYLGAG